MDSHNDSSTSMEFQQELGINEIKSSVFDEAITQASDENNEIDDGFYFAKKIEKVTEDPLCPMTSQVVYQERIKEYAAVNEARITVRNARGEYIRHLQNFTKKISAFDEKYNDSGLMSRANRWQDALVAMQYEKRRTKSIKYDSHRQVRLEIGALRNAREEYEAWIRKYDKQSKSKMFLCCPRCRECFEDFIC